MRRTRGLAAILAAGTACTALFGCGSRQIVGTEMARSGESPEKELQAWEEAKNTPYGKYPELITYTLGKMIGGNRSNMPERDTYEDNEISPGVLKYPEQGCIRGNGGSVYGKR